MHRPAQQIPQTSNIKARSWAWLTQPAFVLAVALVLCRGMMNEVIRPDSNPAPGVVAAPQVPGPATSLGLDLLCCLPALLLLARRAFDPNFSLLTSWSYWSMFLLAILAGAS